MVWRFLRRTAIGRKFEDVCIDLGDTTGAIVMAIIIALSILLAINMLGFSWSRSTVYNLIY